MNHELLDNIEKQLTEIEILKSIYSNSNEFQIEDEGALLEASLFVNRQENEFKRNLGFFIKINADIKDLTKNNDQEENFTQVRIKAIYFESL